MSLSIMSTTSRCSCMLRRIFCSARISWVTSVTWRASSVRGSLEATAMSIRSISSGWTFERASSTPDQAARAETSGFASSAACGIC